MISWAECLEKHGWTRQVAGTEDFDAAIWALGQMRTLERGIVISGEYGVGKTALARVIAKLFGVTFKVRLAVETDLEYFSRSWQQYNAEDPFSQNVWLDDLGAEATINDYGIRREVAGDFIATYHELHCPGTRLIVTTNFNTNEIDTRYGGRILSRLKDLCIPLRLTGRDKREWIRRDMKGANA